MSKALNLLLFRGKIIGNYLAVVTALNYAVQSYRSILLKQNGIPGNLLHLFFDFIRTRKQSVVLNGQNSSCTNVHAGVPQDVI